MDNNSIREIFPIKFKYYMNLNGKKRNDLVDDLGLRYSTVRDWEKGLTIPRMDKVQMLADYFGCKTSDLLEQKQPTDSGLSIKKKDFIKRVEEMTDAQIERLEQILALVEKTEI